MSAAHDGPRDREDHPRYSTEPASEKPEPPSALQTLAGALTAITVTYLMSFLGVAGTVIGVGLVSVLTVLGNFMYSSAIHSAKEKVKHAQPKAKKRAERRRPVDSDLSTRDPEENRTVTPPEMTEQTVEPIGERAYPESPEASSLPGRWRRTWTAMIQRYGRGKIFGSIALVFVLLAGTVTVIELTAGQPLSDIVRNEDSSGTTFFGGTGGEEDGAETENDDGVVEEPPAPEVPQEEDQGPVEEPAVPEAPQEEDQGPVEEPQQEEQQAPEEGAPEQ